MQRITTPIILAGLLLAPMVLADENSDKSENNEIVVTATRTAQTVDDSLASVEVLTRQDIEASGAGSLTELLTGLAGIDSTTNGGLGKTTSLFLRGTNSDHVLVLIDGVKIGSATSGQASLQYLPLSAIERIEVVRGPRSSLYGSEALGGIIQIFTRPEKGSATTAHVGYGSQNSLEYGMAVVENSDRDSFHVRSSYFSTDGINARTANNADLDGYYNASIAAGWSRRLANNGETGFSLLRAQGRNEYDGFTTTSNYYNDFVQQTLGAYWKFNTFASTRTTLQIGSSLDASDNVKDGAADGTFNTDRLTLLWQNDISLDDNTMLTVGLDYNDDRVTSTTAYTVTQRSNTGLFSQWQQTRGRHKWALNLRGDRNQQFGQHVTGGIAWGYGDTHGVRWNAAAGTAFKAPSFNELYWPDTGFGGGNPNLLPEESANLELGVRGGNIRHGWSLQVYRTQISNLIASWPPANVDKASINGVELESHARLLGWNTRAALSLLDPRDDSTGNLLARRTTQSVRLDGNRKFGKTGLGFSVVAQGNRFDDAGNTILLPGYVLANLHLQRPLSKAWTLSGGIKNLLDAQYQTISSYNNPGREFRVDLRYRTE